MTLSIPAIATGKRSPLPPDPSNTRLQGVYASIWQQSSPPKPSSHLARSQSNCERQSKANSHNRVASPWPWQQTPEDGAAAQVSHTVPSDVCCKLLSPQPVVPPMHSSNSAGTYLATRVVRIPHSYHKRRSETCRMCMTYQLYHITPPAPF